MNSKSHVINFFSKEFFVTNHSRWLLKQKMKTPQNPIYFNLLIYSKNKKSKYKRILKERKKPEEQQRLLNDTQDLAIFYKYLKSFSCEGLQTSLKIQKSVLENKKFVKENQIHVTPLLQQTLNEDVPGEEINFPMFLIRSRPSLQLRVKDFSHFLNDSEFLEFVQK